ncbi:MAG: hypothetical protein PHG30_08345 [Eubacteriales bacterium]|nr:hypothetical protein [Eubacteriales bacterium]
MRAEPLRHLEHIVGEHMIRNMADMPHRFRNAQRKMNQGLLAAAYALRHRNANRLHRALKTIHALRMENAEFRTRLSEG